MKLNSKKIKYVRLYPCISIAKEKDDLEKQLKYLQEKFEEIQASKDKLAKDKDAEMYTLKEDYEAKLKKLQEEMDKQAKVHLSCF